MLTPARLQAQFASSPRGARLARRAAVRQLATWGHPPDSDVACEVGLVVAELAANAVQHGRAPGHRFALCITHDPASTLIRMEIADATGSRLPPLGPPTPACPTAESGRGLTLVDTLATRWGTTPRDPLGKTVWAEIRYDA
ncbi:ATP-binding protein [Streptomyces triticagri]|uniref:ATP-binding protein n=1 Tax=Streptomyces triticagri TaxID=2293568 RepID=UPI002D76719C|nr:ATP-binding protein [Streptomyces triticagri]